MNQERVDRNFEYGLKTESTAIGKCAGCQTIIQPQFRRQIRVIRNIWGIPVGTELCGVCHGQRESQLIQRGIYTGDQIDPVPHSEIKYQKVEKSGYSSIR